MSDTHQSESWVDLSTFANPEYEPGRGPLVRLIWIFVSLCFFESGWFLPYGPKRWLLRLFGAKIGQGVVIKPNVRIKYPWRLSVGDHSWLGQQLWIDNLNDVTLGHDVCLSQKVYLCTGSHDHRSKSFGLLTGKITVHDGAWVAANSMLLGDVTLGANTIVAASSVVTKSVKPGLIVGGNPAQTIRIRTPID